MNKDKISSRVEDKESELFALIWLLDLQGIFFHDDEPGETILINDVRSFLKMHNVPYKEGQRNRRYLSIS